MDAVQVFEAQTGELSHFSIGEYPSHLLGWNGGDMVLPDLGTSYGFIRSGTCRLEYQGRRFDLSAGMYFCVPHAARLSGSGTGFIAVRNQYKGLFQIGGPIESDGRLRYIDGCSDTLLISPPVFGDPCLNLLHIPPGTRQTSHTHPTVRLGMIAAGTGICKTPTRDIELIPGLVFAIEANGIHSFNTDDDSLLVIAWHPDSDCGPRHDDHPMINRTIVEGVSASKLSELHTGGI